jgi:hypothetical protein
MCNLSYATTQICSCICHIQLNFSCKRQLQNPKFLVVNGGLLGGFIMGEFLPSESLSYPPSNAWWAKPPLWTWVSKPLLV